MIERLFQNIEKTFRLEDFQRNLDTKRVKAGKYFWHFSFLYYYRGNEFRPYILTNNYTDIFYKPAEMELYILMHFDELTKAKIDASVLQDLSEQYQRNVFSHIDKLLSTIKSFMEKNPQDYIQITPEKLELLELDFIDDKQPYLTTISTAFKRILNQANYNYQDNIMASSLEYIKPNLVHELDNIMTEVIKFETLFHSVNYLKRFLNSSQNKFSYKNVSYGPSDALIRAISVDADILQLIPAQIAYLVSLKYVNQNGKPLDQNALKKAITRYRIKNG